MWLLVSAHTSLTLPVFTPLSMSRLLLTLNHVVVYFSSVIATPHMTITYVTYVTGIATNDSGAVVHKGVTSVIHVVLQNIQHVGHLGEK